MRSPHSQQQTFRMRSIPAVSHKPPVVIVWVLSVLIKTIRGSYNWRQDVCRVCMLLDIYGCGRRRRTPWGGGGGRVPGKVCQKVITTVCGAPREGSDSRCSVYLNVGSSTIYSNVHFSKLVPLNIWLMRKAGALLFLL